MPAGRCGSIAELPEDLHALLARARRAVFTSIGPDGEPHAVPVCHALAGDEVVFEVDAKPKSTTELARVRHVRARSGVALLADRWDEDWTRLAWVMVRGDARIEDPGFATISLQEKYEQYRENAPDGPVVAIRPRTINWWSWT